MTGVPYLITNEKIHNMSPLRFVRTYVKELNRMKELFPVLENYVDSDYKESIRMLHMTGFKFVQEINLPNGKMYYKFRMQ